MAIFYDCWKGKSNNEIDRVFNLYNEKLKTISTIR